MNYSAGQAGPNADLPLSDPSALVPKEVLERLRSAAGGTPLLEVIPSLCALTARVWAEGRVLYDFTDHGPRHSRRILHYLDRLAALLPRDKQLSRAEWFVLVAAALVHDAGMQWPFVVREYAPGYAPSPEGEPWETTRRSHATRSCDLLRSIVHNTSPLNGICPELAYFKGHNAFAWDKLLEWIVTVIGAHTRDESGQESAWRRAVAWNDYELAEADGFSSLGQFRMPLVAALFRLGDELDATHQRVPNLQRLLAQETNVEWPSLLHWASCYFVDSVQINPPTFRLCVDKTKLSHGSRQLQEIAEFLVYNMVHDKLRRSFLKGVTRDTLSISQILLSHGLPLWIDEPIYAGGTPADPEAETATGFLKEVLEGLRREPFAGTVPFHSYSIQGHKEHQGYRNARDIRRVRVIDETMGVRVPSVLKNSFARTQNLQGSRALAFLSPSPNCAGEVIAYSEQGPRRTPATSGILACAAHVDKPEVRLRCGRHVYDVRQAGGSFVVNMSQPRAPSFEDLPDIAVERSRVQPWTEAWVQYTRSEFALVHAVRLRGVHCVIWPPDQELNPTLRNILEGAEQGSPGREVWLQRAQLLEGIARGIVARMRSSVPLVTLSVIHDLPPYPMLTYSLDANSCLTLSAGAVAAAGCFVMDHRDLSSGWALEAEERTQVTVWYDPTQLFQVAKTSTGSVELTCRVKHVLEGRLYL